MKKTIKSFIKKMEESSSGKISGGFLIIRGGKGLNNVSTNGACTNEQNCSGTNNGGLIWHCSNENNCLKTDNDSYCSNDKTCPAN